MRALTVIAGIVCLLASAPPAVAEDGGIPQLVDRIFSGRSSDDFKAVVIEDEPRGMYLAFYRATYLDLQELRAYAVPSHSVDAEAVTAALATGDHETAFTTLLDQMRVSRGAKYVSDVNLDGIRDETVPLGAGKMRDNFHRELFSSHQEADLAYREWLRRATELIER